MEEMHRARNGVRVTKLPSHPRALFSPIVTCSPTGSSLNPVLLGFSGASSCINRMTDYQSLVINSTSNPFPSLEDGEWGCKFQHSNYMVGPLVNQPLSIGYIGTFQKLSH